MKSTPQLLFVSNPLHQLLSIVFAESKKLNDGTPMMKVARALVCACVCSCARARVRVCVCARASAVFLPSVTRHPPPYPPMSFAQHLQLVLDPALPLPLHIDLGKYSCSWENGKFQLLELHVEQEGFRELTRDELMQLMRRLQASPHVILLNLWGQRIDGATMQEIAASIAVLSELQALVLYGACPTSPLSLSMVGLQQQHNHHRLLLLCSLSIPHTLQTTASALKVALRFRHLWFICLI